MRFVKVRPCQISYASVLPHATRLPMSDCLDKDAPANNASAMESRVATIEHDIVGMKADIAEMKVDIAIIKATFASKEDMHRELSALTWRLVTFVCGFGTALVGATYFIAANV
ncbi:hypothetical protein [Pseudoduganella sp. GCM10020061]|uniref:hypothetical protein n=1 Tax=Pseudoduganella sp. GCM10020061 TaxID=3317345 RepID=UPI00362AE243